MIRFFKRVVAFASNHRGVSLMTAHVATVPALRLHWYLSAFSALGLMHGWFLLGTLRPHSRLFGPVVRRLPGLNGVWLTIDDGPSNDTLEILAALRRHRAKATFFLVAENAQRFPELVKAICAEGHEIGNHTYTHPAAWFWALPPWSIAREIQQAQATLTAIAGQAPRWFRAAVGHANPFVAPVLERSGLTRVSWSARGFDAVDGDVERVVSRLCENMKHGAIILMHEGATHGASVEIVERTLCELEARGLRAMLPQRVGIDSR